MFLAEGTKRLVGFVGQGLWETKSFVTAVVGSPTNCLLDLFGQRGLHLCIQAIHRFTLTCCILLKEKMVST